MLHNPYCSPSTSRAAKTSGVNYIPPGLVYSLNDHISQIVTSKFRDLVVLLLTFRTYPVHNAFTKFFLRRKKL